MEPANKTPSSPWRRPDVQPWPNPFRVALAGLMPFAILLAGLTLSSYSGGMKKGSGILALLVAVLGALFVLSRLTDGTRRHWAWFSGEVFEVDRSYVSGQKPIL